MTESPDHPWAKDHDSRLKRNLDEPPSPSARFFFDFLCSKGVFRGRMLDLGCGNGRNAVFFAQHGFEVHAVDRSDEVLKDLDMHGVMPHCHSVTEYWLFEDAFFDLAMDIFCYCEQKEEEKRRFYRSELMRVLGAGGYYLLSVPFSQKKLESEFTDDGFAVVGSVRSNDRIAGKSVDTFSLIMKR
ncbi:MAG: class I SAM-dependent methyltransferase [Candidatus Micrarchaeia archaeon]